MAATGAAAATDAAGAEAVAFAAGAEAAAFAAGAGAAALMLLSTTASTVPTATVVPSGTRICVMKPSAGDGISIETLSVSMSRMISSAATLSPTFFFQLATVPSVTVSPSCGINTFIEPSPWLALVDELANAFDDALGRRQLRVLEIVRGGERHVWRRDAHDRPVEVPEQLLGDDRSDLGAPAAKPRVLLDGDEASRLRDLAQDRLRVERHERAHVDDSGVDAVLLFQDLRGFQRARHHERERRDRDVLAFADDVGFAELDDVFAVGHFAFRGIQRFLLEEHHGVVAADRGGEHALDVAWGSRRNDLEAGDHHRPVLDALRVLRAEARACAVRRAHDERQRDLTVRHVARLRDLIRDDVPGDGEEVREHQVDDWAQPRHRGAHRGAHDRLLRDRRVLDALRAELVEQADGRLEHAASRGYVLAEQHDGRVAAHLLCDAGCDGVTIG